jgi:hypothetical protein
LEFLKKYIVQYIFCEIKNVFVRMTGIGTVTDYKENMYKNEVCRKNKVGDGKQQDLARRKRKLSALN